MRKYLAIFAVAMLAVSIAVPALADVQFLYGGQFRFRINATDNAFDGTDHPGYFGNFAPQTLNANGYPNSYYNSGDNRNFFDQRLRLFFTFVGSKNLKVVTKFEIGDTAWGDPGVQASNLGSRTGPNGGGEIGADGTVIEVKNVYMEFNIPNTPSTAIVGIQTLTLLDSWIIDDDFSAFTLITKLDPFRITLGYVGGQNGADRRNGTNPATTGPAGGKNNPDTNVVTFSTPEGFNKSLMSYANSDLKIDDGFLAVDYTCAPWKSSLVFFYQNGHHTNASIEPSTLNTPISAFGGFTDTGFLPSWENIKNNDLFDIGFNISYKVDWLFAYLNFVHNFGSVDYANPVQTSTLGHPAENNILGQPLNSTVSSSDYNGFLIDAGVTYYCPPYTFNIGGFYTTGPKFSDNPSAVGTGAAGFVTNADGTVTNHGTLGGAPFRGTTSTNVDWFVYGVGSGKYTSEIIGGGVLGDDLQVVRGYANGFSAATMAGPVNGGSGTMYWRGWQYPSNIWTITTGASWQICPETKLSASYWYWGTAEDVPVAFNQATFATAGVVTTPAGGLVAVTNPSALRYKMSSDIGHELNFYVDQKIVDNLTLTLVGAYLIADDAFCPLPTFTGLGNSATTINPALYTSPAATDSWKLGARLQWNF